MGSAQINERQSLTEDAADRIRQRQRRHHRARIFGHLDEVGAAERGTELILNPRLLSEVNGLNRVRRAGDFLLRAAASG